MSHYRTCRVCGQSKPASAVLPAALVRPAIAELITRAVPNWSGEDAICLDDLNRFRAQYVEELLVREKGELSALEHEVVESLRDHDVLASNVEAEFETRRSLGERLADRIASFGGSWTFILLFAGVLAAWVVLNSVALLARPFDPYPYILLNLVLSCLAALQAPVIMMSQNRQEARDRLRAMNDYQVNLKAELEIRQLHQKLDHLLSHQWQRLVEIQQVQLELMNDLRGRR